MVGRGDTPRIVRCLNLESWKVKESMSGWWWFLNLSMVGEGTDTKIEEVPQWFVKTGIGVDPRVEEVPQCAAGQDKEPMQGLRIFLNDRSWQSEDPLKGSRRFLNL
eukprot:CAMPEP_0184295824 /NCGR_PEP_ID=MMETSP1049-20130417/6737_1 /TAXON_ID=77928 /ORGANISM="Proteomonas sulcata, Strain CCMP704" /LENGTH=105 /DNA_ID=CAMNT_0026604633 /DNA_START=192 /DNA_END=510 /DNA_ORIENTATION=+